MIERARLSGRFSSADVEIMNAAAREAIFYFDIDMAELDESERSEIIETIETNIVNNFYQGRVLWQTHELLPEAYRRFLETRVKR